MVLRPGAPDDPHTAIVVAPACSEDSSGTRRAAGVGHRLLERTRLAPHVDAERPAPFVVAQADDPYAGPLEPEHRVGVEAGQLGGDESCSGSGRRYGEQLGDVDAATGQPQRRRDLDLTEDVRLPSGPAGRDDDVRHETRTIVTWPAATVLTTEPLSSASDTSTRTVRDGPPRTDAEPPVETTRTSRSTRTDF